MNRWFGSSSENSKSALRRIRMTILPMRANHFSRGLSAKNDWERLRGFPGFSQDAHSGDLTVIYTPRTLQDDDRPPLAPIGAWQKDLQEFSDIFPSSRVLADAFFFAVSGPAVWQLLNEKSIVRTDVMLTNSVNFGEFFPDEPLADGEHKTIDTVIVSDIVDREAIIARVRDSRPRALRFWRFLTEWLIKEDVRGLEIEKASLRMRRNSPILSSPLARVGA